MKNYTPTDWYWIVAGDETQLFSSAIGDYVQADDATYQAWAADGTLPTRIASEIELGAVLADARVRPENAVVLDSFKDRHADVLTMEVVAKILLWLINEVRGLKGQQPVTGAQVKAFIKDKM